jgi:hypothetical protein
MQRKTGLSTWKNDFVFYFIILKNNPFLECIIDLCIYLFSSIEDLQPQETEPTDDSVTYHVSSTSTLVIRKESSDSSHECIILDVIHHVLIKNICTCAV